MPLMVVYDISNDKARNKIVKKCKEVGLYRIQKSIFLGEVSKEKVFHLKKFIEDKIDKETDSVYLININKKEINEGIYLGNIFDKDLVLDEISLLFF